MPRVRRIRVSDRDVETLATLGEYGVLDRDLCHTLCFAQYSAEWCRQSLTRLADAGLVRATALRVWHDDGSRCGRIPLLYSLTPEGAEIVHAQTGVYPRRVLRSDPSSATFWHRLGIARVRVAFDLAARAEGLSPPRWIHEQDLRPDAPRRAMPQHRRMLYHEFRGASGNVVTCRPDAAAVLIIPHPSGDASRATSLAIHFEIDRSTEGIGQCESKVPGFALLFEHRSYVRYWPDLQNAVHRVCWIVRSRERIDHLAAAFREMPAATIFRFAAFDVCRPDRILTQPVWTDLHGSRMTLYRRLTDTPRPT